MDVHIDSFDPETIDLMRAALDHAWSSLPLQRQTPRSKSTLAAAIISLAARGERDTVRLSRIASNVIATRGEGATRSAGARIKKAARRRHVRDS